MKLVNLLTQPMHHCEDAVSHLLKKLDIEHTRSYLQRELVEHPDYPSLAAVADVIGMSYDVSCASIRIPTRSFKDSADFRPPFLALVRPKWLNHEIFAVIEKCDKNIIELYNPATKVKEIYAIASFEEIYKGLLLIVETGSKTQEEHYKSNLYGEKQAYFFKSFALLALPVITVITSCVYLFKNPWGDAVAPIIFTVLVLAGSMVTALLLWHEVDEYNPVVKQVCQATTKTNCSAVLNSKASKIWGISWSSLGFAYFTGQMLALLSSGIGQSSLTLFAWINLPTLIYPVFSLYYQWKVAKEWCVLCLTVQAILLLLFITAFAGSFYNWEYLNSISAQLILGHITLCVFVFAVIIVLTPALQKAKKYRQKTIELQRLKHNPQVFEGVLTKQKSIMRPNEGLGIVLGRPDSMYRLVKVCNPYCGPCAKAHPIMDELITNNDEVSLQIIFTATEGEGDIRRLPVMHFLAVAEKGDEVLTKKVLDDWYLSPEKDYDKFAAQSSMNEVLNTQIDKIRKMNEWCNEMQIRYTPTFFISVNNTKNSRFYQLPDMYTIADLKYFFAI